MDGLATTSPPSRDTQTESSPHEKGGRFGNRRGNDTNPIARLGYDHAYGYRVATHRKGVSAFHATIGKWRWIGGYCSAQDACACPFQGAWGIGHGTQDDAVECPGNTRVGQDAAYAVLFIEKNHLARDARAGGDNPSVHGEGSCQQDILHFVKALLARVECQGILGKRWGGNDCCRSACRANGASDADD